MANPSTARSQSSARSGHDPASADIHVLPRDLGALFAQRPLILGEDETAYDELLSHVTAAVKPADAIEALWVHDIVVLAWEAQRLRRLKVSRLMSAAKAAIDRLMTGLKADKHLFQICFHLRQLSQDWVRGIRSPFLMSLQSDLARCGLDLDAVMAQALSDSLGDLERIERMIASVDARRNRSLNEIERRRLHFARRLRTVADDVASGEAAASRRPATPEE